MLASLMLPACSTESLAADHKLTLPDLAHGSSSLNAPDSGLPASTTKNPQTFILNPAPPSAWLLNLNVPNCHALAPIPCLSPPQTACPSCIPARPHPCNPCRHSTLAIPQQHAARQHHSSALCMHRYFALVPRYQAAVRRHAHAGAPCGHTIPRCRPTLTPPAGYTPRY